MKKKTIRHKKFDADVKITAEDQRTVTARISTAAVDREGDVLIPQGCNSKDYEANPVIMLMHSYYTLPIGKVVSLKRTDDEVVAKIEFAARPADHPEGVEWVPSTIFSLYQQGVMNAFSVGFIPTDMRAATAHDCRKFGDDCKQVVNRWKLLEISAVGIPCNQEAVAMAVSKGLVTQETADKLFKVPDDAAGDEDERGADKMIRPAAESLEDGEDDEDAIDAAAMAKGLKAADEEFEPLAQTYTQYTRHGNTYEPAGAIKLEEKLGRFAYRVGMSWGTPVFTRMKPQTDTLYKFDNSAMTDVLGEIDRFWDLKGDYEKLGLMHNRGVLMYGPPGMGKTSAINQVADLIVGRGDVVLYAKNIGVLGAGLEAFREVEPERKAVVVLEDADEYVGYQEREFLQLLDGEKSVSGVLYLATTNYLTRFPARLLRPGRFDKQVYVGPPPYEGRLAYLTNKLKEVESVKEIERLAKETDGFSFGHLRELITAVYALKEPVAKVLARLKESLPPKRDYAKMLATVKSKGWPANQPMELPGSESVKEVRREITPTRRVAAVVDLNREDEPATVKHIHRFLEPKMAEVTPVKVQKVVVRTMKKMRGRIYDTE